MNAVNPIEEKELLVELRSGDRSAFEKLYAHYSGRIYGKILKLTQSEDTADELLQEVFISLWEKRHLVNPDLSIKAWLYKVAENSIYLFYRKLTRDRRLQEQIILDFTEQYSHIEEDIYLNESRELLNRALEQLSPQRKAVFNLCKIEGKSYEETAQLLGISSSTVSNHLVKANLSIKKYIFQSKESIALMIVAIILHRLL